MIGQKRFLPHLSGDRPRLRPGAGDLRAGRRRHRRPAGRPSTVGRGRRADPGRALFAAQDHALSGDPAAVRPRHVGQGRVRRAARHHPGGAVHHERRAQRQPHVPAGRPRDAAHPGADGLAHPDSRHLAGDLHRPAHRLLAHPAGHDAGRAVRLAARAGLPADDGDRSQRRADHPVHRRADLRYSPSAPTRCCWRSTSACIAERRA